MKKGYRSNSERLKRTLKVIDTIQHSLISSAKVDIEGLGQMALEFLIELVNIDRVFGMLRENDFLYIAFVAGIKTEEVYGTIVDSIEAKRLFTKVNEWISLKDEELSMFPVPSGDVKCRSLICFSYNDRIEFVMGIDHFKGRHLTPEDEEIIDLMFTQISLAVKENVMNKKVSKLSRFDPMTGFYLRRYFLEELKKRYGDAIRYNRNFTLLTVSLSEIKHISAELGYTYADRVIKIFSDCLKRRLRRVDLIGKIDYSCFSILMMESDSLQAREKFKRIYEDFSKGIKKAELPPSTANMSVGMASFPDDSPNIDELIVISKRYYLNFGVKRS